MFLLREDIRSSLFRGTVNFCLTIHTNLLRKFQCKTDFCLQSPFWKCSNTSRCPRVFTITGPPWFFIILKSSLCPSWCKMLPLLHCINTFFICSANTADWLCGHNTEWCQCFLRGQTLSHTHHLISHRTSAFLCTSSPKGVTQFVFSQN